MATRYTTSTTIITSIDDIQLKEVIENRGVKNIEHYKTANLIYPTPEEINNLNIVDHIWKSEDKYWKLSSKYYGNPKYWWVIAWFNKKPIEASIKVGDTILIPQPLADILGILV